MQTPLAKISDVHGPHGVELMIDRLVDLCGDREDSRIVLALGRQEDRDELQLAMRDAGIPEGRLLFLQSEELTSTRTFPERTVDVTDGTGQLTQHTFPEKEVTTTIELPHSLATVDGRTRLGSGSRAPRNSPLLFRSIRTRRAVSDTLMWLQSSPSRFSSSISAIATNKIGWSMT
jgi:hypothetical protein